MKNFDDRLTKSAQNLAFEDNRRMHVPSNPLGKKASYWGWVATPAAAVVGIVLGMSLNSIVNEDSSVQFVQSKWFDQFTTLCISPKLWRRKG